MDSEYSYRFSEKSVADLDEIVSYLTGKLANPQAADDFLNEVEKTIHQLRVFPETGALVLNDFLPNIGLRKTVIGNYIMYYLPNHSEHMVYIVRLVYGKRSLEEILRTLQI